MEPNTLRLQQNTWEKLSDEAEERGFRNRSEYIREIIAQRDVIFENTNDYDEDDITELVERIEALEAQQSKTDTEPTHDPITTEYEENTEVDEDNGEIDTILGLWFPKTNREEKREAGRQALVYLRKNIRAKKADFLENVEHLIEEQNEDTYWKKTIRPALQEAQDEGLVRFDQGPPHEYVWER